MKVWLLGLGFLFSLKSLGAGFEGVLEQAIQQAEAVREKGYLVQERTAFFSSAQRRLYPTLGVSGELQYLTQFSPDSESYLGDELALNVAQPLYQAGYDRSIDLARLQMEMAKKDGQLSLYDLYRECATAYFGLLGKVWERKNLTDNLGVLERRVTVLSERKAIGRSNLTELLAAKTEVFAKKARIVAVEKEEMVFRKALTRLTKWPLTHPYTTAKGPLPQQLGSPYWGSDPEIQKSDLELRSSLVRYELAKEEFSPQLDAVLSVITDRGQEERRQRAFVGVQLQWPLYNFSNRFEQEGYLLQSKRLEWQKNRILEDKKSQFEVLASEFQFLLSQKKALEEALAMAKANVSEHEKDYERGLVTTLELLSSIASRLELKQQLDTVEANLLKAYWLAQLYTGKAPVISSAQF